MSKTNEDVINESMLWMKLYKTFIILQGWKEYKPRMDKRIRVKDLAPFASIEDLSDDENAAERDKQKTILSNIEEEIKSSRVTSTSKKTNNGAAKVNLKMANATPRIDVWRASTASHQEDSSSERELILGKFCHIYKLYFVKFSLLWYN